MISVLNSVKAHVDETIEALNATSFTKDPIAGNHFSKIVSVISSAYKRHGLILEETILAALKTNPKFEVWRDAAFPVTQSADAMVGAAINNPKTLLPVNLPISISQRTIQIDIVVFDKSTKLLTAYEVKRGNGLHDAGKKRSMLRDVLCTQILLQSYGNAKGFTSASVLSKVIFYYGKCSLPKPWALKGDELDAHFNYEIYSAIEEVNEYFRNRLFSILST
jgi:hypothetical protein